MTVTGKRLLSMLVAVVMLLGMLPAGLADTATHEHIYDWRYPKGKAKNCLESKPVEIYCTICGKVVDSYDDLGPHEQGKWYWDGDKPENCLEYGIQNAKCKLCGEVFSEREIAGSHKWGEEKRVKAATCMNRGVKERTCSVCGLKETWETDYGSHDWGDWFVYEEATCIQKGSEVRYCRYCNEDVLRRNDFGPHAFGEWYVVKEAEIGVAGLEERKCSVCELTEQREIPALVDISSYWPDITIKLDNTPANGTHFVPGEAAAFTVTCSNPNPIPATGVQMGYRVDSSNENNQDHMLAGASVPGAETLEPNTEATFSFTYTVTDADAERGAVYAAGFMDSEPYALYWSSYVTVPCGLDGGSMLEVTVAVENTPANGTHFVLGEKVFFHYYATNVSGGALYSVKASFMDDMGPRASVTSEKMEPGATIDGVYEITVTDVDVSNGAYYAFAMASGLTEKDQEAWGESDAVSVPCGEGRLPYLTEIDLELVSVEPVASIDPDDMTAGLLPGDPVKGVMRVTNVGETTVTLNAWYASDINGNSSGVMYDWNEKTETPPSSWFKAGETLETEFELIVTQTDIDNGAIYRSLTQYALPYYCIVNGEESDVPADIEPMPDGVAGWYGRDEEECSDTIEIIIPLTVKGEVEKPYHSGIDLELVSVEPVKSVNPDDMTAGLLPGDPVKGVMRVTNVGETTVTMNSWDASDINGNFIGVMFDWNEKTATPLSSWFMAGETLETEFELIVTQTDIDNGQIYRKFTQYARPLYCVVDGVVTDVPADIASEPEGTTGWSGKEEERCSDTIEIIIPLMNAGDAVPELECTITLHNQPENGEYFVPGERALFIVHYENPAPFDLVNAKIDAYTCANAVHNEGIKLDKRTVLLRESVAAGEVGDVGYDYTFTEEDAARGVVYTAAMFFDESNNYGRPLYECYTNFIPVPCGAGELSDDYEKPIAMLEKYVKNEPANGEAFVEGETIEYAVIFMNCVAHDLYDVEISDPLKGNNEDAILAREPVVESEGTLYLSFDYVVTAEDVERGYVENVAAAMWMNPEINEQGQCESNKVIALTADEDKVFGVLLTKSVASLPANGSFYTPGETVVFDVEATNYTGKDLQGLEVCDALFEEKFTDDEFLEGETHDLVYRYVVTELDAQAGSVSNYAWMRALGEDGYYLETSNVVTVDCGFADAPFGVIDSLSLVMQEESSPANGKYYTEGEVIHYSITYTNDGEVKLTEVMIYDAKTGLHEIAAAEMFAPGEVRTCYCQHTVTAEDVQRGYVENYGTAVYPMPGGTGLLYVYSNSVYSDTDGEADEKPAAPDAPGSTDPFESVIIPALPADPADPADPAAPDASDASAGKDFGKVNWEKLSGEAHCVHEIMVRTANSASYGNSFCAAHTATADAAAQQDGEHAAELWKADVLAMYEKLLEATDETARMNLTNEYLIFSSMMSNRELLFKTVYADQPQEAARLTALAWRDKCIGMCYEMSTAPEARADSLLYVEQAENVPGMEKKCAALTENETAQGFASADIICREHSVLFGMTDQLIGKENTAQGWQRVYQLWNCELNKAYNRLGSQLGEEKNVVLALERSMTEAWLGSRAAQLMALYPENPEICAEIITRAVMAQVQLLCGLIR